MTVASNLLGEGLPPSPINQDKRSDTMNPKQRFEKYQKYVPSTIKRMFADVDYICKRYLIEYDDLLQMGRIGLWEACNNYDPNKGTKFLTYAINHIKWSVYNELYKNDQYVYWKAYNNRMMVGDENNRVQIQSLDSRVADEGELTYHEVLSDENVQPFDSKLCRDEILNYFNHREREIARMLERDMIQSEIAEILNVSKQRVGQIVRKMREKLQTKHINNIY